MRFLKTLTEQHGLAKRAHFSIILVVHIHHFEGFLRQFAVMNLFIQSIKNLAKKNFFT